MPMLNVLVDLADRDRVAGDVAVLGGQVLESYEEYAVVEVPDEAARQRLEQQFPVEDVTSLYTIQGSGRELDTSLPRIDRDGKIHPHPDYADEPSLPESPHHYLMQFVGPVKQEWLAGVVDAGGQLRDPHGHFTYVVLADPAAVRRIAGLGYVRWLGHLPYHDRIDPSARESAAAPAGTIRAPQLQGVYTVEFFRPLDLAAARNSVEQLGFEVVAVAAEAGFMVVRTEAGYGQPRIERLATVHGVKKVRPRFLGQVADSQVIRWTGAARTIGDPQLGLDGAGQVVAVCDNGLDSGNKGITHKDLRSRTTKIIAYPIAPDVLDEITISNAEAALEWDGADSLNGHGSHVAGVVVGDGTESSNLRSGPIRGLAPAATLVFQAVGRPVIWKHPGTNVQQSLSGLPLDLHELFIEAAELGARIHCNAWSRGKRGDYDEQSFSLDDFVWNNKDVCVVVAAGNADQEELEPDGVAMSESVNSPGTAKNCITVGASGTDRRLRGRRASPNRVRDRSCRGPTRSGRYKPDVVAPGFRLLSARSSRLPPVNTDPLHRYGRSEKYMLMSGTSQATAVVAGAVALLRQHLVERDHDPPSAALLKAALIAGATRLGPRGRERVVVDNVQGYGRVNLDAVVRPDGAGIRFEDFTPGLLRNQAIFRTVNVRSPSVPFRVVLAYTDHPGASLVNNLNLRVQPPGGAALLLGNQPQRPAEGPYRDTKNNVEVVEVERPAAGRWRIEVRGRDISKGPQPFALVYRCHL